MNKKYSKHLLLFLFFSFLFLSCKKRENKVIVDESLLMNENIIIRPITEDYLDEKNDSIKKYYELLDNYEIWYNLENRNDLITSIQKADEDGLNPSDYNYSEIKDLESKREKMSDEEVIYYDILLTDSFDKLAKNLFYGKVNPNTIYNDWDLRKKNIVLSKFLEKAIKEKTIAESLNKLKPQHTTYISLKKALKEIKKFKEINSDEIKISNKIEIGDKNEAIIPIKKRLKYWGDYTRIDSAFSNLYDNYTEKAIKNFQKRHGLLPDGVIGNGTIKALNFTSKEREEQIIVNLERWRWFPRDFGTDYIISNLPNYKLDYVTSNDTIIEKKIVIGTKKRSTPIICSKISNLVINPTWTVPPTIIKEDLTPKATKDRTYFNRTRLTIYKNGEEVTPEDWDPEKFNNYRYVQDVGYNNSLGLVKFNFPNRHMVYLHDTNHRDYFSREYRALSSGCVRVEKPLELANIILKKENNSWEESKMNAIISLKKTKVINLKTSIDVYLLYWTAWYSKEGLQFREDIYDLDKNLYQKLRS